jgi:hypothetical protein
MQINNDSKHGAGAGDSDVEDYVADMREAYADRQEQVAEELRDMAIQDDEFHERVHKEHEEYQAELMRADEKRRAWLVEHKGTTWGRIRCLDDLSSSEIVEALDADVDDFMSKRFHVEGCLYCKGSRPGSLGEWLAHMSGAYHHEFSTGGLHVVSRSAALLDAEGRRALGMFSLLGDAAITYAVVDKCFGLEYSKSRASDARSRCTNWAVLSQLFVERVPVGFVQFPSGVDPGVTRSGGEALEALFGLVASDLGVPSAMEFAHSVGVFSKYKF